jgi:GT2 family glycosyltransferase
MSGESGARGDDRGRPDQDRDGRLAGDTNRDGVQSTAADWTVIISTRNRRQLLRETVASILAGTVCPEELIVVDQSDRPDLELPGLFASARCVPRLDPSPQRGSSRGRNRGIALARTTWLAFVDDDVRVEADWLARLSAAARASGADTVVTGMVAEEMSGATDGFAPSSKQSPAEHVYDRPVRRADPLYAGNMATHVSVFDRLGTFDERLGPGTPFPAAEDNDLAYRLLRDGVRIRYCPDAVVHHRAWRPRSALPGLQWGYGVGQGAFLAKHAGLRERYGWGRFRRDVLARSARLPYRFARSPIVGWGEVTYLTGLACGFLGWKLGLGRRDPPTPPRPR